MKRKSNAPTDEEIMEHANVPVWLAASAIGWSSCTLASALQQGRVPFGFAVQNDDTGTWAYNINPAGLIRYRHGEFQGMGMRELTEIWSDIANSIVDAKLESARVMAAAVTGAGDVGIMAGTVAVKPSSGSPTASETSVVPQPCTALASSAMRRRSNSCAASSGPSL